MLDDEPTTENTAAADPTATDTPPAKKAAKKAAAKKAPAKKAAPKQAAPRKAPAKKVKPPAAEEGAAPVKRTRKKAASAAPPPADASAPGTDEAPAPARASRAKKAPPTVTFQPPEVDAALPARRRRAERPEAAGEPAAEQATPATPAAERVESVSPAERDESGEGEEPGTGRRRRRRGRRGRGGHGQGGQGGQDDHEGQEEPAGTGTDTAAAADTAADRQDAETEADGAAGTPTRRRRRRRRSGGEDGEPATEDGAEVVTKVRAPRAAKASDEVRGVSGSTRLEAKRQRRREGREQGRRRPPILSEAEFLARREAVERTMVVRQTGERTQIGVLEDGVLVEHYVTKAASTSYAGNIYLGRVQNVLPSMEAAFVDIGKGRNAVLYAGEVNFDASEFSGRPRKIEQALKSGQSVLVQVTKDPIGHKGARLTSQISLPGRYLVYVPEGRMTGISRKLPDTERSRLKGILKTIVPDDAGVIIRTAAEGASEEELTRDVRRLQAQWEDIAGKAGKAGSSAPSLLYAEPDLVVRVIRDVFNEDFASLVVQGEQNDTGWDTISNYVEHVAPDLAPRLSRHTGERDVFAEHRVDEQLVKALDRKVWLPSGGSLVIDRTEAMVVVDVNTGKFTGAGGNLEETVTKNNLEAAEEIVRQLRLRDLGGIIVIDFIDMVLESNRDLVLRRLTECLGRDRTKHQVAEVTSLGLVQMTRKRVGQGLLESFSEQCPECGGRGVKVALEPAGRGRRRVTPADVAAASAERVVEVEQAAETAVEAAQEASSAAADAVEVAEEMAEEVAEEVAQGAAEEVDDEFGDQLGEAPVGPTAPEPLTGASPDGSARARPRRRGPAGRPAGPPPGMPEPEPVTVG